MTIKITMTATLTTAAAAVSHKLTTSSFATITTATSPTMKNKIKKIPLKKENGSEINNN